MPRPYRPCESYVGWQSIMRATLAELTPDSPLISRRIQRTRSAGVLTTLPSPTPHDTFARVRVLYSPSIRRYPST